MPKLLVDPYLPFIGKRFKRLLVLEEVYDWYRRAFLCRCDCGTDKVVTANHLKSGRVQSCGCLHSEVAAKTVKRTRTIHGETNKTPEYNSWRKMIERCTNPNSSNFAYYGGQGITVHELWRQGYQPYLEHLLKYLGRRPSPQHSIDRIDPYGNYEPGNIRWATKKKQANNRRKAWARGLPPRRIPRD